MFPESEMLANADELYSGIASGRVLTIEPYVETRHPYFSHIYCFSAIIQLKVF